MNTVNQPPPTRTARELILQNPENVIQNLNYTSYSNKDWAQHYPDATNFLVHTWTSSDGLVHADFDSAFLPLDDDDERRIGEPAHPPNQRFWQLEVEADVEHFWHTEISDVVLAAWARWPRIVQTCHTAPSSGEKISETVDATYALYIGDQKKPVVIGEMKRNLILPNEWMTGTLRETQQKLARELRGYADKYECPQVFLLGW
ncbi:hypothetical protein VTH06DRAFT_5274 [Thermothelomyces fergusii]